jgi:catechol 2,3-dioxygenase-like lactoylglutathione lyase family enzyme
MVRMIRKKRFNMTTDKILGDNFNGFQHVGIPVTDIRKSEAFYAKLGFDRAMHARFPWEEEEGEVVMMKRGPVVMELYQFPEPERSEIGKRKDGHIDHITFDVHDIDSAFQELQQAGFTTAEEAPVFLDFWEHGCRYFNVLGPDNERLEFNEQLKTDRNEK